MNTADEARKQKVNMRVWRVTIRMLLGNPRRQDLQQEKIRLPMEGEVQR